MVLDAARAEFLERGYDAASVRGIARRAGVDPGTVRHWYADKRELLTAMLGIAPLDPAAMVQGVLPGAVEGMGERLVRGVLGLWDDDSGATVRLVMPAVMADPDLRGLLPGFLGAEVLGPVVARLGVPDARRRASLVASQVAGLLMTRYLVPVEPLASMPVEEVARLVGPNVQRYLTEGLD